MMKTLSPQSKLLLVPPSHPALSKKLDNFNFEDETIDRQYLVDGMVEMMQSSGAAGLAANQLGLEHRVFVLNTAPKVLVCFNPKIVHFSEKYSVYEEGCLTYPGFYVKIRRPENIRVRFQDIHGNVQTENLNKLPARAFQHELDHLDGINYMSRAKRVHMEQAKRKMKLITRKLKRLQIA